MADDCRPIGRGRGAAWPRVLVGILCACAACYLAAYLVVACRRMPYPCELEWMEGGALGEVARVLAGKPLYVEPSLEFTPFGYTPLFFWVGAAAAWLFGLAFFPLRLVSFAASLGIFALLFDSVRRDTGSPVAGIVGAGLFAATYRIGGAWLDIARVDSLFLLLLLPSIHVLRFGRSVWALAFSGLLAFLSFIAKQTALPVAIAMSGYCLVCLPRWRKLVFPAVVALLLLSSTLLLQARSGGWYWYHVFHLPSRATASGAAALGFWLDDLGRLGIAIVAGLVPFAASLPAARPTASRGSLLFLASMVGASWYSRLNPASFQNVLLPALAAIALAFGRGVPLLAPRAFAAPFIRRTGHGRSQASAHEALVLVLFALQFLALRYDPSAQLPTKEDERAGDALVRMIHDRGGDILVPSHGYLAVRAGGKPSAHLVALTDVLRNGDEAVAGALRNRIARALDGGAWRVILLDQDPSGAGFDLQQRYALRGTLFEDPDVFWPVTGLRTRPELIYELRE